MKEILVKHNIGFSEMLDELLENEPYFCARRSDWPSRQTIWIYSPDYHEGMSILTLDKCLILSDETGYSKLWLPTSDDLFSFDWEVVNLVGEKEEKKASEIWG